MKIRFQADADFNQNVVRALRRRQPMIDFQTADDARLRGLNDPEVLAIAEREGRILVSHDRHTMPQHFADFLMMQHSPGVFILSQYLPISQAVEELLMVWEASEAEEWIDTIQSLPL
jgi:predicted nuclease of predicted toxin-antitoxin system